MLIKAGVDISRLKPPIRKRLSDVGYCYKAIGEEMIITGTYDGNHSDGSLHYADLAVDFRYPTKMSEEFREDFMNCFGPDYDISFETRHIHVEYDPKPVS